MFVKSIVQVYHKLPTNSRNMNVRNKLTLGEKEKNTLAPYAVKSIESKGRKFHERDTGESFRLCFQKDRDRIVHCKAFRRLDEKTQVFPAFFGDHYRTRLTHTLEVAQIGRDICRRLGLNEDLAEAIALAHDLGHPPFGHAGEDALNEIMKEFGLGFEHNLQSLRVVEKLEKLYPDFDGLNLSFEVLDGLKKHQTVWDQSSDHVGEMHLEGQVVNLSDEIAYTNHDIDDGLRSGILTIDMLRESEIWRDSERFVFEKYGEISVSEILISRIISRTISSMIEDICENFDEKSVTFSEEMKRKIAELRKILYEKFYLNDAVKNRLTDGKKMIKDLFKFYLENPNEVSEKYKIGERIEVAIKDYIAGMTDQFLIKELEKRSK